MAEHELATVLRLAAGGVFPAADAGWGRVGPWRDGVEAVLAMTGHAWLAVADDVTDDDLAALAPDGLGGAHHPRVVQALAGDGWVDALDVVLVADGGGSTARARGLVERDDLAGHPRVAFARTVRDDVRVWGRPDDGTSLVTVGRGLAGLTELGVEVTPGTDGTRLVRDAVAAQPAGSLVLAAVAPGNARALRSMLGAGFRPVASVQLYRPRRRPPGSGGRLRPGRPPAPGSGR